MIVLGVDPAWAKPSAWALLSNEGGSVALLDSMRGEVNDFFGYVADFRPDVIAIEDQFFFKNVSTAKKLCWSAGQFMAVAKINNILYEIINVSKWKNYWKVTGKNSIYTPQSLIMDQFGQNLTDDASCAALIAYYYIDTWRKTDE
jgi:hypothetical protein